MWRINKEFLSPHRGGDLNPIGDLLACPSTLPTVTVVLRSVRRLASCVPLPASVHPPSSHSGSQAMCTVSQVTSVTGAACEHCSDVSRFSWHLFLWCTERCGGDELLCSFMFQLCRLCLTMDILDSSGTLVLRLFFVQRSAAFSPWEFHIPCSEPLCQDPPLVATFVSFPPSSTIRWFITAFVSKRPQL